MTQLSGKISQSIPLSGKIGTSIDVKGTININTGLVFAYNYPPPTGQTTEYAQYDDAWQYFNVWKPLFDSMKGKKIVAPTLFDFFTMQDKNQFGGYSRFTDINGNTIDNLNPAYDTYFIDHYTGLAFKWRFNDTTKLWHTILDEGMNYTEPNTGFSIFYMPNNNITLSLGYWGEVSNVGYSRGFYFIHQADPNTMVIQTSTTITGSSDSFVIYYDRNNTQFPRQQSEEKSTRTDLPFYYRIHYQPKF